MLALAILHVVVNVVLDAMGHARELVLVLVLVDVRRVLAVVCQAVPVSVKKLV